ncbi:hypothetical protein ES703_105628 [subsurface metagenome]
MLFLVTYRWRDGEQEYYTRRFTNSEDLSDMWADETINDNGDYQPPCGYPIVRISSITGCNTLEQAVKAIGFIDDDIAVEALRCPACGFPVATCVCVRAE